MKTYTIENETNNITVHASVKDAVAVTNAESFRNEARLAKLAANWPAARLVEIFNDLPGVTPVKKFKDRQTAVTRIWKAIQNLGEAAAATSAEPEVEMPAIDATEPTPQVGEPAVEVADADIPSESVEHAAPDAQQDDAAQQAEQDAQAETENVANVGAEVPDVAPEAAPSTKKASRAKKTPTGETNASAPREGSKTSQVIVMLKREGGATLEEIMAEMGWLKHTTRAMLSAGGSLMKKHGLVVTSEKVGDKRTYSIKA